MKSHLLKAIETILDGSDAVSNLLANVKEGKISERERLQICSMLGAALVREGLEKDGEPNSKGLLIEAALDEMNRPVVRRGTPNSRPK